MIKTDDEVITIRIMAPQNRGKGFYARAIMDKLSEMGAGGILDDNGVISPFGKQRIKGQQRSPFFKIFIRDTL